MRHSNDVVLTAGDLNSSPLWYFFRMPSWGNQDLWWGWTGWEAFGWWEGENPFEGWEGSEDKDFCFGNITYLKSLDYKKEKKTYSEPQSKRAFFIVKDLEEALDALEDMATSFSLGYEDGVIKLLAWNKDKPEFKACLMVKHNWEDWCDSYYKNYTDFGWKLLEYTYSIATPDPVFKDGKLVFGDEFEKTPEEFVEDLVKAAQ